MSMIQEPRECLPSLVIEGSPETLEAGHGLGSWDPGRHNTARILSSFCFKIWDPRGRLPSAIMLWISIPSPARLRDDWEL